MKGRQRSYQNGPISAWVDKEWDLLDAIWAGLAGKRMLVADGQFRAIRQADPKPLILSHYCFLLHGHIKPPSCWTPGPWAASEGFERAHGVSGKGRIWRASILAHPDIDQLDPYVDRRATRNLAVDEFILTTPIDGENISWQTTGWPPL